jgi:1-deoxy-D-xylulose-5-phosphate reductoisomerase
VLNAANEAAVEAFLNGGLAFLDIPRVIGAVLSAADIAEAGSLDDILRADAQARQLATERIGRLRLQNGIAPAATLAG